MTKINMGCGWRNFGEGWVHIDAGDYEHLDYNNISKLEFTENSVDLIYASHLIAYFNREQVVPLLKEWIRVLKVGGTLRIATPDFGKMTLLYQNSGADLGLFLGPLFGKMNMGEDTIYHKTVYDFTSLKTLLEDVGLSDVDLYRWQDTEHHMYDDHSQAYIPHMDKENGTLISLNVQGFKK